MQCSIIPYELVDYYESWNMCVRDKQTDRQIEQTLFGQIEQTLFGACAMHAIHVVLVDSSKSLKYEWVILLKWFIK